MKIEWASSVSQELSSEATVLPDLSVPSGWITPETTCLYNARMASQDERHTGRGRGPTFKGMFCHQHTELSTDRSAQGMREMREARAKRKYNAEKRKKQHQSRHLVKGGGMFSFLSFSQKKRPVHTFTRGNTSGSRNSTGHRSSSHRNQPKRPSIRSRGSSGPTKGHRPSARPHDSNVRRGSRR